LLLFLLFILKSINSLGFLVKRVYQGYQNNMSQSCAKNVSIFSNCLKTPNHSNLKKFVIILLINFVITFIIIHKNILPNVQLFQLMVL